MTHSLRARRFVGGVLSAAMLGGLLTIAGCGPSTAHLAIADAKVAVEAARGARAETFAVFEFTCAIEHLRKAREEEGYSDFDAAVRLAKAAEDFAQKAKARALGRPAGGPLAAPPSDAPPVRVILPGSAR